MITIEQARKAALALPETVERLHFHLPGFWIGKKIFATIHADKNYVMVKLSPIDQSVFCAYDKEVIFPVPGGWGKHGATFINLKKVRKPMFLDALATAWKTAATSAIKKKYANKIH
ncbi:MAG TPA: MmcQ/YjbR family DNA-binding protein [Chitinophagaceae bacterium]|nr:MmcQ/YjbR family DNA-binding protein [Chitinophagaceae bacterium]